jgi:DNA repair protein RecN (Recombination protein N)
MHLSDNLPPQPNTMLSLLRVSGFALIDSLEIELTPGLTVITGETGAGKSIMVEALGLLRGGRARAEVIRGGSDTAQVEAIIDRPGTDSSDEPNTLVARRVIARTGRGRNYLDGRLATVAELEATVGELVDITSQHDQQSLMDPESQRLILDAFAKNEGLLQQMAAAHAQLVSGRAELERFDADARGRGEREDFLRFQLSELEAAALQPGEDEKLRLERDRVRSAEKLRAAVAFGEEALYGADHAASARIAAVVRELEPLEKIEPAFAGMIERLRDARAHVEDVARELSRIGEVSGDAGRLEEIEERLYLVSRLTRKHGGTIDAAIANRNAIATELAALGNFDEELQSRRDALDAARQTALKVAVAITDARRKAARALSPAIADTMKELGLEDARVDIRVEPRAARGEAVALAVDGADQVWFEFTPNPGEPGGPLSRVASGGELSRVMLAIKRALAHADRACTYVFDEVDTGVGGNVADAIGRKLKAVSETRQVLVVTHLPQIAAFADRHLMVRKRVRDGRTVAEVFDLDAKGRQVELARMLGGHPPSDEAVAHAGQLLRTRAEPKKSAASTRQRRA